MLGSKLIFLIVCAPQSRKQRAPVTLPSARLLLGASCRGSHGKPDIIPHFRMVIGHVLALKPDPLGNSLMQG